MLNVSVTNLDLFRAWREDDDLDMGWLISRFRGEEQTEQMRAGSALHSALEAILEGESLSLMAEGYRFEFIKDVQLEFPGMCRELSVSKAYGDLKVRGRVDATSGLMVIDYKTTSQFDPDRLMHGYQWRFYLDMTGADVFRWQVFVMRELDEPKVYGIVDFHELEQHRYPELQSDCARLAQDFYDFAKEHYAELYGPVPTLEDQLRASVEMVQAKKALVMIGMEAK